MTDPLAKISTRTTSQSRQADPAQVKNHAGGYAFVADDMNRLRRFLATGVEGGTYYAGQDEVAIESSDLVLNLIATRPTEVLATVLDMSERGATTRQQPLMFTMAALAAAEDAEVRDLALRALPKVARTGTHLFLFASYVGNFRGWGKGLRKAIARWYDDKDVDDLAYQIEKYRSREGWSHRDLLLLAHVGSAQTGPVAVEARKALYKHAAGKDVKAKRLPLVTVQALALAAAETPEDTIAVIESAPTGRLSWEMVKSEHLGKPEVWAALLDGGHVPITALLRNLARLTTNGTLDVFGQDDRTARVIGRLTDSKVLAKGRVHPMSVLLAAATYASGRSLRGTSTWAPIPNINKALDAAFLRAFPSIEPDPETRVMIGVDVSGSMDGGSVGGLPLNPRTAAGALGMALAAHFPRNMGVAFTSGQNPNVLHTSDGGWHGGNGLVPLDLDPTRRVVDLIREMQTLDFGRTDCSLPILYATEKRLRVDTFIILTDNETWAGGVHPHQALKRYREVTGIQARMVTVAMVNNPSTIADPKDPLMLDVVGLDSNAVSLVADFAAGKV